MAFGTEILIIFAMLFVNAVFAGYEMALASISNARIEALFQEKRKGALEAKIMKGRMEASLAMVQLGITLAGAIAAATGGAGAQESITPYFIGIGIGKFYADILSLIIIVLPLSALTIIFAELVPKMFAITNREWVCLAFSPLMLFLSKAAYPVIVVFEVIVKGIMNLGVKITVKEAPRESERFGLGELKAAVTLARASKLIGAYDEKIVLSASMLSINTISKIMLEQQDIFMIPAATGFREAMIKAHLDMHTRFPVCEKDNDPQTIIGYINFKDIISAVKTGQKDNTIRSIVRPMKRIPSNTSISQALEIMVKEKTHITLVVDAANNIVGMITIEDIVEELVGQIEDEYDKLPVFLERFGLGLLVGGGVKMKEIFSILKIDITKNIDLKEKETTLSSWIEQKNKGEISGGEVIKKDGIVVVVRKLRRKRVYEAYVGKVDRKTIDK